MSGSVILPELIDNYKDNKDMHLHNEIEQEISRLPLLSGISVQSAEFLLDAIKAVVQDDIRSALDEVFRLSDDEIPDLYAESYLILAQNLSAACDYADGWIMFKKELVRLYINNNCGLEANNHLKQLEEVISDDEELMEMRSLVTPMILNIKTDSLVKIRENEEVDKGFDVLMKMIADMSGDEIFKLIIDSYNSLPLEDQESAIEYFATYPFWGALDPKNGVFDALRERARVIRNHYNDFVWLHKRLADARSKNVLYAILSSWIVFDGRTIREYTERDLPEYYHLDIFPYRENDVFVDIGAYVGDSVATYINTYGVSYKRIYCYEIAPETFKKLEINLAGISNTELRQKAVGAENGTMFVDVSAQVSSERVVDSGEVAIEVVRLDDDITEPVTFIKMDIEGAEKDALRGSQRHICEDTPNLAICTYHGYDDLYAIPRLIDEIKPGYKFYMRYHGGCHIPTEYSLLAVWEE